MSLLSLVRRNLLHYRRTNLAVVAGVAVAVAVLAGALLVGASVRSSLRALALERLGAVDRVVTSARFVPASFGADLLAAGELNGRFGAAAPLAAVEGFVTHQASGRRASGVRVYGVDERFWTFHGLDPEAFALGRNAAFVSAGLAGELEAAHGDALLVSVEQPSAVPLSSLHGRRDDVGRTLRIGIDRVLDAAELGEFSFRPQQGLARSVFVPLARLQGELEQEGRVNTLLLGHGAGGGAGADEPDAAEDAARQAAEALDAGHLALLDKHKRGELGGTGAAFDWTLAKEIGATVNGGAGGVDGGLMLAGGLTPENVADAIETASPWGVDVSSGVETGGVKDHAKIRGFARAVATPYSIAP